VTLQQLRYLAAVVQNDLNVTAAATSLHTSQPGVSKQLKLLEEELGLSLFIRDGRALTRLTAAGEEVAARALRMVRDAQALKGLAKDLKQSDRGVLSIGTTHTQARYVLPRVVRDFRGRFAHVQLHLHQGTSEQIAELASLDRIDFAILTGSQELFADFILLPCYTWYRHIIVPKNHPLAAISKPTIAALGAYPLVTYSFSFTGRSSLQQQFARAGVEANVALTARDADVIKTYVRLGLGIGVVASMAIEPEDERDLAVIDASHLFPQHLTWVGFRAGALLRGFMYEFVTLLAPHLDRDRVARIIAAPTPAARDRLIAAIHPPAYD
jgi:LysR family transcriptional regulator, cys regulon transcriptional activator